MLIAPRVLDSFVVCRGYDGDDRGEPGSDSCCSGSPKALVSVRGSGRDMRSAACLTIPGCLASFSAGFCMDIQYEKPTRHL